MEVIAEPNNKREWTFDTEKCIYHMSVVVNAVPPEFFQECNYISQRLRVDYCIKIDGFVHVIFDFFAPNFVVRKSVCHIEFRFLHSDTEAIREFRPIISEEFVGWFGQIFFPGSQSNLPGTWVGFTPTYSWCMNHVPIRPYSDGDM